MRVQCVNYRRNHAPCWSDNKLRLATAHVDDVVLPTSTVQQRGASRFYYCQVGISYFVVRLQHCAANSSPH